MNIIARLYQHIQYKIDHFYMDHDIGFRIGDVIITLIGVCVGVGEEQYAIDVLQIYYEKLPDYWRCGALFRINVIHGSVWGFDIFFIKLLQKRYYQP
jgi:hypothetical protein